METDPDARGTAPADVERVTHGQWLLPLIVFAALSAGGLAVWWSHQRTHGDRMQLETEVVAEQVRYRLETWIDARITLIGHFADHWAGSYAAAPEAYGS
jgi:sensor domain CHASE-containing protein